VIGCELRRRTLAGSGLGCHLPELVRAGESWCVFLAWPLPKQALDLVRRDRPPGAALPSNPSGLRGLRMIDPRYICLGHGVRCELIMAYIDAFRANTSLIARLGQSKAHLACLLGL
jgi:hypothetical protein